MCSFLRCLGWVKLLFIFIIAELQKIEENKIFRGLELTNYFIIQYNNLLNFDVTKKQQLQAAS